MTTKGRLGGPPGPRDRKRPAPTIDLKATEVASEPIAPAQPAEPPVADPAPAVQASAAFDPPPASPPSPAPSPAPPDPVVHAQTEPPPPEPPPAQPSAASAAEDPSPPRSRPAIAWLPPDFPWPLAAASAAGVVLTLIALALAGVFSSRDSGTAAAETRIARMEQQVRELAAKPAPTTVDPGVVNDLASRLARLETIAATPKPPVTDPALANRIATLEGEIRALGERVGVLGRRSDEIASIAGEARTRGDATAAALAELRKAQPSAVPTVQPKEVEALSSRIAALERTAKAIEAQLGSRVVGEGGSDRSLRALLVASALNAAVDRGAPYAAELGAAKAAAPDPKVLAALDPFAKAGVPGTDALARELLALVPALAKAAGTASRDGGILDRLKANAERIVRVRPLDEVAGDDPVAVIQRIEARATQGNLAGAMAEIGKLPAPARALATEWIAKVEARNAAVEASRRFAADALAALGKPSL